MKKILKFTLSLLCIISLWFQSQAAIYDYEVDKTVDTFLFIQRSKKAIENTSYYPRAIKKGETIIYQTNSNKKAKRGKIRGFEKESFIVENKNSQIEEVKIEDLEFVRKPLKDFLLLGIIFSIIILVVAIIDIGLIPIIFVYVIAGIANPLFLLLLLIPILAIWLTTLGIFGKKYHLKGDKWKLRILTKKSK